ncbi:MAG: metallophosphoesterase family protein [Chloroherpetonaceae bacterium]|nr:metallophosphoesterase family protein [Chloroherpetonaceae bacterium]
MNQYHSLYAIGDIHGCLKTLHALMNTLDPKPDEPLIFLGDYIDRGAKSFEVVQYLLELSQQHPCYFLRGNHEEMLLQFLTEGLQSDSGEHWLNHNGGNETLQSYRENGFNQIPDTHLDFFNSTHLTLASLINNEPYFFVHGGLNPALTIVENLTNNNRFDLLWERRHLKPPFINGEMPYAWEATIVCGHTPVPAPVSQERLIAIDTGCVYNFRSDLGKLTAVHLPSREFISVPNCESSL